MGYRVYRVDKGFEMWDTRFQIPDPRYQIIQFSDWIGICEYYVVSYLQSGI
jgi:hypothetical protein